MKRLRPAILLLVAAIALTSCSSDDVDSKYSSYSASFSLSPVNTIAPLTNAMSSYGEFCTITKGTNTYNFHTLTEDASVNRTALSNYKTFICIAGFIVGRSSSTELGTGNYNYVCYDLACSSCYHDDLVSRALTLESGGRAYCSRCKRTYDLNNDGLIVSGNKGTKLERYHINYNTLSIYIYN